MRPRPIVIPVPVRVFSDATGQGGMASLTYLPEFGAPWLLQSLAGQALNQLARTNSKVYIFELFAATATIFAHRAALRNRKLFVFIGNEAACAAPNKDASRSMAASELVYRVWAIMANISPPE